MNGKLLLVCLLALCATVPTVAVSVAGEPAAEPQTETLADGSLTLESTSPYAIIDDDTGGAETGELEVNLTQLNDEAVTTIDDLMEITAHDDSIEEVAFESDALTFYESASRTPITAANPVSLDADESVSIGVTADTTVPADEYSKEHAEYTVAIETTDDETRPQPSGPELTVTDVAISVRETTGDTGTNQQLQPGKPLVVTATYENVGDTTGSKPVTLSANGTIVDTGSVTLDPGETDTLQFEWHPHSPGPLEIGIGDEDALLYSQTVPVGDGSDHEPELVVDETVLESDAVDPGEETTVRATVSNTGNKAGTFTPGLAVGGLVVDDRAVSLAPGEQATVAFAFSMDDPGTYELAVADEPAGTVTVGEDNATVLTPLSVTEFASPTVVVAAPPAAITLVLVWYRGVGRITSIRLYR
ncbi:uncharacterized protein Nmag_3744 (plasmid) [Natrialba magadii ATCC 43099]|uniref:CARDB domain-containing protein n=1 Tax=Natrialba magadii (strain ATCC 43099 / DSM 3394 / CCM 3739 / CIP 104546 / IAM 13178 / JCM 8861 / NBRC 102185 / NCIMB 2190 / MS3) TaxID=547559 RepID=D3T127_NATMM|nr:CARDB domain-containing protein [Natrialba magadii]ADD07286.1 uncharacterized protein Nmag_3744 [Natrialba magadii ATCC 43099]ELY32714.1 hypothetical protein C500_03419 [Natrialba magadii ATCC 43099]